MATRWVLAAVAVLMAGPTNGASFVPVTSRATIKNPKNDGTIGCSVPFLVSQIDAVLQKLPRRSNFSSECRSQSLIILQKSSSDDHDGDIVERNQVRCDIQNFLTQRAIQSFMYLCESVRDPHSVKWLEEFLGVPNQLNYHGVGMTYLEHYKEWDGPLVALSQQPKDVMIVSAKRRGRGHGGWSKDNPFLEERFVEFEIDIDPVSLASRILQVREQLAREWVSDLELIQTANEQILESYFSAAKEERRLGGEGAPVVAFERTAVALLHNHTGFTATQSSPFRKGSFDLLYNLCTQAAVHRLLQQLGENRHQHEVSYAWLRDFYADSAAEYFDGDVAYGRADDFMEQLLLASPSIVPSQNTRQPLAIADPMGIAEQIILLRSDIAAEWRERMLDVPAAHQAGIRKVLLEKQMEAWGSSSSLGGGGFE